MMIVFGVIESFTLLFKLCCGVMLHSRINLKIVVLIEYAYCKGQLKFHWNLVGYGWDIRITIVPNTLNHKLQAMQGVCKENKEKDL